VSASAERLAAARLLVRVAGGAFSSRLLDRGTGPGVRARVLGVLRWQRLLDEALARPSRRPLESLDPEVLAVLRLGLFERAFLGVPAPVATDAAVNLVRRLGKSSAAGMVNAVLRRAAPVLDKLRADAPADVRLSHPAWLFRRWSESFGSDTTIAVMEADQEPAGLWVWFPDDESRQRLEGDGARLEPHPWCPGAWRAAAGAELVIRAVRRGLAYVQDPSSQLAAHLAARLARGFEAPDFADVCAAPGGKAALAAGLGRWGRVVALDRHPGRARLMRANLARLGRRVPVVAGDAGSSPLRGRAWDCVLLDAPCSGTGTLRRHPELRWRLDEAAIGRLVARQTRLLRAALELPRAGGIVLYVTCSLEPEENEGVVAAAGAGLERVSLAELLPAGCPGTPTAEGGVRIFPAAERDGFTLHALRYNPGS